MNLAKLAATAGLFLVAVHSLGALGDGLTVRHVRSGEVNAQLVLVFEIPLDGVEVQLTLAAQDYLAQLAAVLEGEAVVAIASSLLLAAFTAT